MRCAKCHQNEASIDFTPVMHGKPRRTVPLCKDCAPALARCIEVIYRRVTPREFARLQSDPKAAASLFAPKLEDLLEDLRHGLQDLDNRENLGARQEQEGNERHLFI